MEMKENYTQKRTSRRNSTLLKTLQKNCSYKFQEIPAVELQKLKISKITGPKTSSSPNSNQKSFRIVQRKKHCSQESKMSMKIPLNQQKTLQKVKSNSFISSILMEKNLQKRYKNQKGLQTKDIDNFLAHGPMINDDFKSLKRTQQIVEQKQRDSQVKRKRSKTNNIQCKILLAKNNGFPFMVRNLNMLKNSIVLKDKQIMENKFIEGLELDISRINQNIDLPEKPFISKESFRQIIIF